MDEICNSLSVASNIKLHIYYMYVTPATTGNSYQHYINSMVVSEITVCDKAVQCTK